MNLLVICFVTLILFSIAAFLIYLVPVVLSRVLGPKAGSMKPKGEENTHTSRGREGKKVGTGSRKKEDSSFSVRALFKKKKTCERCGKELEYKEQMGSYYCPDCHTYYRGDE